MFGIAMGGEWGVGASLTMESIPPQARGFASGLPQSGYPTGYFLASIVYGLLFQYIGWRGMFMVGVIPALLVLYIRRSVPESPTWRPTTASSNTVTILKSHWRLGIYAVLLMTAFNFFSHGTQDLYPTFLQVQHGLDPHEVGLIAVIYNIGAIIGGISFGSLSEHFGRRRIIVLTSLLSFAFPVHLNELSPDDARGTFPGFVYQLGNLIASVNATLQAGIAARYGDNYSLALAIVAGTVAVVIVILTAFGTEERGVVFGNSRIRGPADPKTTASPALSSG
jgi:SHS family lactate transporter-like MFS transporter